MPIPHKQDDNYGYNDCFECHKIVPVAILSIVCYILVMRIIEPPLAGICQDMIDCIGNKDAEPEIVKFFYRMQQLYLKGWRECGFCKGTGRVTTVYPNKWGAKETVEHSCLTCKGLGFYDFNAMVREAEERRKKLMEEE